MHSWKMNMQKPDRQSKLPDFRQYQVPTLLLALVTMVGVCTAPGFGQATGPKGSAHTQPAGISFPKIDRRPAATTFRPPPVSELPHREAIRARSEPHHVGLQVSPMDLRQCDVSTLDLHDRLEDLLFVTFDETTRWPEATRMPAEFDPRKIIELGKNPGLGLRKLHAQGVTGKGVGIAIIDQTLLTEHVEYKDRLRLYEESPPDKATRGTITSLLGGTLEQEASMHGTAVASIIAGKTIGVAPKAELYYIASSLRAPGGRDFTRMAKSVFRVLEINKQLPADRRIRVIAISDAWKPGEASYEAMNEAARAAMDAGLLLACENMGSIHGLTFLGIGRAPLADPDRFESYQPELFRSAKFVPQHAQLIPINAWMVPADSRTTASPHGATQYVFYRGCGWCSSAYIAGLYALAAQVDPSITPERFRDIAMKTGETIQIEVGGKRYSFGSIANPQALINELRRKDE